MSIPRALGFDDDEVFGSGGGGSNEKSSKSNFSGSLFPRKVIPSDSMRNSRCRAFGLVQASRFGDSFPKAISRNQNPFKPDHSARYASERRQA